MSKRPYDPYRQKANIPVLYIRYSKEAVKQQKRAVRVIAIPACLLAFAALPLAGIAQNTASEGVRRDLYRVAIPICTVLSAALFTRLIFVYRKAYKEKWYCIYSTVEQALMENRLPVFRTQEQQDTDGIQKGFLFACFIFMAVLMIAFGIWSLFQ